MKVSVVIPCKGRLSHLKQCLPRVGSQYKSWLDLEIVVVDYNCPDGAKKFVLDYYPNSVLAVKAPVGAGEWNLSAARNYGYRYAAKDADLLLFLDADALLERDFLANVVSKVWQSGAFVCGWGAADATGCCLVQRTAFEQVGGYNELCRGYGFEDISLYNRLEAAGFERRVWPEGITTIKHSDELRATYQEEKDIWQTNIINGDLDKRGEFKGI